jgi:hypothetical protein
MKRKIARLGWATRAFAATIASLLATNVAFADGRGVSFWLPGSYGSLAAVPQQQPGWAFATFNYFTSVSANADVARAFEIEVGKFPLSFSGTVDLHLHSRRLFQATLLRHLFLADRQRSG